MEILIKKIFPESVYQLAKKNKKKGFNIRKILF